MTLRMATCVGFKVFIESSGLCYEHIMMIVKDEWCLHYQFGIALPLKALARVNNYAPRVTFEIAVSLTDESKVPVMNVICL